MNKTSKALLSLISLLCFSSCGGNAKPTWLKVTPKTSEFNLQILKEEHIDFLNAENPYQYVQEHIATMGKEENSKPKSVYLSWDYESDVSKIETFNALIGTNVWSRSGIASNSYISDKPNIEIPNLMYDTEYECEIRTEGKESNVTSNSFSFKTEEALLRPLDVDGVSNVRDLAIDGKIKQGYLYRTAQFNYDPNELNPIVSAPTEKGKDSLINELRIKTEIDLRKESETVDIKESPIGVNYIATPMTYGGKNIFTNADNKESIRLFFESLTNENNYPIAFHCVRGTDRTGALAYVLEAMCGVDELNLKRDYLFSNFANIGTPVRAVTLESSSFYVKGIENSEGETFAIKTKNYLHNTCDISYEIMDKIISIIRA